VRRAALATVLGVLLQGHAAAVAAPACFTYYVPETIDGAVVLQAHEHCPPVAETSSVEAVENPPPTSIGRDPICVATAMSLGEDSAEFCDEPVDEVEVSITPGLIAQAMRAIPVPAANIGVEPPNGRTLVNFDTNFFTDVGEFERQFSLLGQRVTLRLIPDAYQWNFGDGTSLTTRTAGARYPNLEVTHRYAAKGLAKPSVDVTWKAIYRIGAGPWADVPSSVIRPGDAVDLQVLTATPTLVGYE
jgi:hypothetical protein